MLNYEGFHAYLRALVDCYARTRSLSGISLLAREYCCTSLTKEEFFELGLNNVSSVSRALSDVLRIRLRDLRASKRVGSRLDDDVVSSFFVELDRLYRVKELPSLYNSLFRYAYACSSVVCDYDCDAYEESSFEKELRDGVSEQLGYVLGEVRVEIDRMVYIRTCVPCYDADSPMLSLLFVKLCDGRCFWLSERKDVLLLLLYLCSVVRN